MHPNVHYSQQPRHESNLNVHQQQMNEWIKYPLCVCVQYSYTYYSALKRKKKCHCGNMDGSGIYQKEEDQYATVSLTQNLKYDTNLFTKQKQTHRHRKQTYGYQRGNGWGRINSEFGFSRSKLLYIKQTNHQVLQDHTGNYM